MKSRTTRYKYKFAKIFTAHQAFVVVVSVLLVLVAVFVRINTLNNLPIDQAYLIKQSEGVNPVKFDENAIEKIKTLNESNVNDPGTQLSGNRNNPFSE